MSEIELLIQELKELRATVTKISNKTDQIKDVVDDLSLRVEKMKVEKLIIKNFEIDGLEFKLGGIKNEE